MLNISELTPLYAELSITPPLNYPLWYHTKISLFPQEIKIIDRDIDNAKFDVVVLQNTHGQVNFEHFYNDCRKILNMRFCEKKVLYHQPSQRGTTVSKATVQITSMFMSERVC